MRMWIVALLIGMLLLPTCRTLRYTRSSQSIQGRRYRGITTTMASSAENMNFDNVILYDGVCNFCNTWVDIILKIDFQKKFRYAALQSDAGGKLLEQIGKEKDDISSVVLVKQVKGGDENAYKGYFKSSCVTEVIKELNLPALSPAAVLLSNVLPLGLKDVAYETVARNRYNFLGKRNTIERLNNLNADRFLS